VGVVCRCCSIIQEVVDKARGRHYQLACALAFEGVHGTPHDTGINKPSDYYAASVELVKGSTSAAAGAAAADPAAAGRGGGAPAVPGGGEDVEMAPAAT
jgi:DNA primase large subunit